MGEPTQGVLERESARERETEREISFDLGESTQADPQVVKMNEPMQGGREEGGEGGGGGGGGGGGRASSPLKEEEEEEGPRLSPSASSSSTTTLLRPSSSTHRRGKTPDHKARGTDNRGLGFQRGKTPDTDRSRAKTPEGSGRGIPPGFPPPAAWILATKSILLAKSRTPPGSCAVKV